MNNKIKKNKANKIYLTGFMATGKSSVGKVLSKELGLPFKDLDNYIEEKEGQRIKEIFDNKGEVYFRDKEKKYLLELNKNYNGILALGGGSLQNQNIVNILKETGILVYIETPMSITIERILRNTKRPIVLDENGQLKPKKALKQELETLFENRKKLYYQADIKIFSNGKQPHINIANRIIRKLDINDQ